MTNVVSYLIWDASMQLKVIYGLTISLIWERCSEQRIAYAEFAVKTTDLLERAEIERKTPFLILFFFLQPQAFHRNIKAGNNTVLSCNH